MPRIELDPKQRALRVINSVFQAPPDKETPEILISSLPQTGFDLAPIAKMLIRLKSEATRLAHARLVLDTATNLASTRWLRTFGNDSNWFLLNHYGGTDGYKAYVRSQFTQTMELTLGDGYLKDAEEKPTYSRSPQL